MRFSTYHYFFTATILEWKHQLQSDKFKDIIISRLAFLAAEKRAIIYGFVVMSNPVHIIWQVEDAYILSDVQHSFMNYTAQMMLKELRNHHPEIMEGFRVDASDRKHLIWERNPLSVALWAKMFLNRN